MCWTVNEIKKGVWHVDESGLNAMYVVKGSKMSAVIDAGTGIGDFKGLVESLVDNPYVVLITHGHVDHAGGCGQFIEAYINERDYQAAYKGRRSRKIFKEYGKCRCCCTWKLEYCGRTKK